MKTRASGVFLAAIAIAITAYACGGSDNPTPPTSPTPNPPSGPAPASQTVTISGGALSTRSFDLAVGGTITFVNNDTRVREMSSNPHPAHTDCPALNVGALNPGQQRTTAALTVARSCGFHDHGDPSVTALQGTVTVR